MIRDLLTMWNILLFWMQLIVFSEWLKMIKAKPAVIINISSVYFQSYGFLRMAANRPIKDTGSCYIKVAFQLHSCIQVLLKSIFPGCWLSCSITYSVPSFIRRSTEVFMNKIWKTFAYLICLSINEIYYYILFFCFIYS